MTQANTSDLGRRLGPVDYGTPDTGLGGLADAGPDPGWYAAMLNAANTLDPEIRAKAGTALSGEDSGASLFFKTRQAGGTQPNQNDFGQRLGPTHGALMPTSDKEKGMNPAFQAKLDALIAASGGKITIESGFRDEALQTSLWDKKLAEVGGNEEEARQWVAKPASRGGGGSNHTRGIAADLHGDMELAHQLAPRFGLYFPMSWEQWHIEPIGSRDHSHPDAYTNDPTGAGRPNPTQDPTIDQDPAVIAAHLSAAAEGPDAMSIHFHPAGGEVQQPAAAGQAQGGGAAGGFTPGGKGDTVAARAVYTALRAKGLDPMAAGALTAIAGRESGYNPSAYNGNRQTGDDSYGLFQINLLNGGWSSFLSAHGVDPGSLRTFQGSIDAAAAIYKNSGLHPWGGYKGMPWQNGSHLADAVAASNGEIAAGQLENFR